MHELPANILLRIPARDSRGTPTNRLETQLTLHHELRCGRQWQPAGKKFIYMTSLQADAREHLCCSWVHCLLVIHSSKTLPVLDDERSMSGPISQAG